MLHTTMCAQDGNILVFTGGNAVRTIQGSLILGNDTFARMISIVALYTL